MHLSTSSNAEVGQLTGLGQNSSSPGDEPARRFAFIATALRKLKAENKLTTELKGWLSEAEAQLAQLQTK